jgi:hypothetical protein
MLQCLGTVQEGELNSLHIWQERGCDKDVSTDRGSPTMQVKVCWHQSWRSPWHQSWQCLTQLKGCADTNHEFSAGPQGEALPL